MSIDKIEPHEWVNWKLIKVNKCQNCMQNYNKSNNNNPNSVALNQQSITKSNDSEREKHTDVFRMKLISRLFVACTSVSVFNHICAFIGW